MQSLRQNRINYEKFHLMDVGAGASARVSFKLCGSSIHMYTITLTKHEYHCNCPDYKNVGHQGILCKHICYILIKIIGLTAIDEKIDFTALDVDTLRQKISIGSVPYQYYKRLKYFKATDKEMACVVCYENHPTGYECVECKQFLCEKCCCQWMENNSNCPYCRTKLAMPNDVNYINLFS